MPRLPTLVISTCLIITGCASSSDRTLAVNPFDLSAVRIEPGPAEIGDVRAPADGEITANSAVSVVPAIDPDEAENGATAHHITLFIGNRSMSDDNNWDPVDEQDGGGIEFDSTNLETGNGYEFGAAWAWDERDDFGGVDFEGTSADIYGGYRHTFFAASSYFHPYLGAGLTVVRGELETSDEGGESSRDDDKSLGAYARVGVAYDVHDNWRVGIDYRRVYLTDTDIGRTDNSDFGQFMLTLGFGF